MENSVKGCEPQGLQISFKKFPSISRGLYRKLIMSQTCVKSLVRTSQKSHSCVIVCEGESLFCLSEYLEGVTIKSKELSNFKFNLTVLYDFIKTFLSIIYNTLNVKLLTTLTTTMVQTDLPKNF